MKKVFAVLTAFALVFSLVACGSSAASSQTASQATSQAESAPAAEEEAAVEVDEGLIDVTITMPASWFSMGGGDPVAAAQEYVAQQEAVEGIKSVTVNKDGSVTIVMTRAHYQQTMDDMKSVIDDSIAEILAMEDTSITSIEYTSDFSEITVTADQTAYESNFSDAFVGLGLAVQGIMYQMFSGVNPQSVTVNVVDAASGEIFDTTVYPDAIQ